MTNINVLAATSIPYSLDKEDKSWKAKNGHPWNETDEFVKAFAEEAETKIRKRSKNYGKIKNPPKPNSLADFYRKHLEDEKTLNFSEFVRKVQAENNIALKASRAQSKLVLIFLKYQKEIESQNDEKPIVKEKLIVVLLKDKSALRFSDEGIPQGTDIIDFDDVMQGAIIDSDEFSKSLLDKEDIDISFINGSSGTTNYFINFFDAKDIIKNKESVNNVLTALEKFLEKENIKRNQRDLCTEKVIAKLQYNGRNGFKTTIKDIDDAIYSSLKDQKNIDIKRSAFEEFVNNYDYKVNEEFSVTNSDIDKLEFISLETGIGSLKLKRSHFKKDKVGDVAKFNENDNTLTVTTKVKDDEVVKLLKDLQRE
ncbi:nucleoid-associated protein [Neptunicella marina]|uniref:Nucleoid-associated protein n=1 Tax=Neptunicella marina TaxID=2125989 RepID=A0A8J6M5D4_9ALTE|nr:nucleoid-associated protein [Neptunicella marina]MBC3766461.1 nucleoid-associated protein [Neptunicella marina]